MKKGLRNRVVRCPKCGQPGTLSYKGVRRPTGRIDWYLVVDHRPFGDRTVHTVRKLVGPPDPRGLKREKAPAPAPRGAAAGRGRGFFAALLGPKRRG